MTGSTINIAFATGTDTLNITSGGLIGPNNNQTIGATLDSGRITAGGLTPAANSDLYVYNRASTLTINSRIIDNTNGGSSSVRSVFTASGGARMQEGTISLMQMPRTVIATRMVKEAGLPFIVVLCDPTTGGVTASFAMLGDIQIAEPGAMIGFAGARVIEQTVREKLPEGFQRAEYLLEHGILDMVVKRHDMRETLARLISLLREKQSPAAEGAAPSPPALPAPEPAAEAAKPA
jgi:hypothetical protein